MTIRRAPTSVLPPPPRPSIVRGKVDDLSSISKYLSTDLYNYLTDFYNHSYFMWKRTGEYEISTFVLSDVKISAKEANTLLGIDITKTVQSQLNEKANLSLLGSMAFQDSNNVSISGGSVNSVTQNAITVNNSTFLGGSIEGSIILPKQGSSGAFMTIGGLIVSDMSTNGSLGIIGTDLTQYLLEANTLDAWNAFLEIDAFGTFAGNANNKRVRLYFGSTLLIDTGNVPANSGSWYINSKVIRVNINAQKAITTINSNNVLIVKESVYITATEDLTTNIVVKTIGQGISNDDVVQEGLIIKMFNG